MSKGCTGGDGVGNGLLTKHDERDEEGFEGGLMLQWKVRCPWDYWLLMSKKFFRSTASTIFFFYGDDVSILRLIDSE